MLGLVRRVFWRLTTEMLKSIVWGEIGWTQATA